MDLPESDNSPVWWKMLNLPADWFSKKGHNWSLNNYHCLDKVGKNLYVDVAKDIKEFDSANVLDGSNQEKVKLGRKIASIPALDYFMHPELQEDPKALRKYLKEHPELRVSRSAKYGNLANGPGFSLHPKT